MTTRLPILCLACTRYRIEGTCAAFPSGIPVDILRLGADHRSPVPNDNGIVFNLKMGKEQQLKDWTAFHEAK